MPDAVPTSPPPVDPSRGKRQGARHRFLATLLTFPRRPWVWSWPLATALIAALVASRMPAVYDESYVGLPRAGLMPLEGLFFSAFVFACAVGFCAAAVTGHFAGLLNPPRGHVVPGLRRAGMTAMILLTVAVVVGPAVVWPHPTVYAAGGSIPVRPHAFVIAALLASQLAWTQFAPVTGVAFVFTWATLAIPGAQAALVRMLVGRHPALEYALLFAAAALFAALWIAIARRRDRTYETDPIAEAIFRTLARLYPAASPARPPAAAGAIPGLAPATSTPRARRRLYRLVAAGGNPAALVGFVVGAALAVWMLACHFVGSAQPDAMTPRVLCFMVAIIPAMFATASGMENRGALIAHGLLLPASRAQYVRAIGLAMLANLYTIWVCALLPVLVLLVVLLPADLRPTPRTLGPLLIVAVAYQFFAFGVIAWLLRLHHRLAIVYALTGLCALGVVLLIDFGVARTLGSGAVASFVVAAILAVAGLAFSLTAYRHWSTAEPPSAGPSKTAAAL